MSLSEKIAELIESESNREDLSDIFAGIEKINQRLDKIEAKITVDEKSNRIHVHPSTQKFAIAEAIVDELFAAGKDKACTFEPNGKPCDHCSMCSSRGF